MSTSTTDAQQPTSGASLFAAVEAELRLGEQLVWADRPGSARMARYAIRDPLIGIPFTGFVLFFFSRINWHGMGLGSLAFVGFVALWMLFGGLIFVLSPLISAWSARKTIYAITDRRLLIIHKFPLERTHSYAPALINNLKTVERVNGEGDIIFRKETKPTEVEKGFLSVSVEFGSTTEIGFFGISEVRKVEAAIQRLVRGDGLERPSPSHST